MSATGSTAQRRVASVLAAVLVGAWVFGLDLSAASAAGQPVVTGTVLQVLPATGATVTTPVSFSASVTPAAAAGFVRFTGDGRILASVDVVGGTATTGGLYLPVGTPEVVATFVPYDPGAFTSSQSSPVRLAITGVPTVWVTTAAGTYVPGSAPVQTGRSYQVKVAGYPAYAVVVVRLGTQTLTPDIRTDAAGTGSLNLLLPSGFAPGVYTLDASAGSAVSQAVFYVIAPGGPSATTAAPVVVADPSSTPPSTEAPSAPEGTLASTGADTQAPLASGLLLLLVGALLVAAAGGPRSYVPRH